MMMLNHWAQHGGMGTVDHVDILDKEITYILCGMEQSSEVASQCLE